LEIDFGRADLERPWGFYRRVGGRGRAGCGGGGPCGMPRQLGLRRNGGAASRLGWGAL